MGKRGGKRDIPPEKRCTGITKAGKPCQAARAKGSRLCTGHLRAHERANGAAAEVVDFASALESKQKDHASGRMTREQYLDWLQGVMTGAITESKQNARGEWKDVEACARDKMTAGREYRMLMDWDGEQKGDGALRRAIADIVTDVLG